MERKLTDKQKIYYLFQSENVLYFSDIVDKLDMDLKKVVKICKSLLKERKIRVHKENK